MWDRRAALSARVRHRDRFARLKEDHDGGQRHRPQRGKHDQCDEQTIYQPIYLHGSMSRSLINAVIGGSRAGHRHPAPAATARSGRRGEFG
jgi:hypothetical protein